MFSSISRKCAGSDKWIQEIRRQLAKFLSHAQLKNSHEKFVSVCLCVYNTRHSESSTITCYKSTSQLIHVASTFVLNTNEVTGRNET